MSGLVNRSSRPPEHYEPAADSVGHVELLGDAPQTFSTAEALGDSELPERLLRILVAQVSDNNRLTIRGCLKSTRYRIEEAEDADIAVKKFKLGRYDVVLLEMHRPLVEGYSTVRELRKWEVQEGLPSAPLVALIPSTSVDDQYQALSAACDDCIRMPVSERSLLDAIQAWTNPIDPLALAELRAFDAPGQESLLDALIVQFVRDLDSRLTTIRRAVSAGETPILQITAHTLRGSCGHFGAHRMARLCACLERNRREIKAQSSEVVTELEIEAMHVRLALAADLKGGPSSRITRSALGETTDDVFKCTGAR